MSYDPTAISTLIRNRLESFQANLSGEEVGLVVETADGIVRVSGLPNAMLGEMISFPDGIFGIVFNLEADHVVVIILGKKTAVTIGDAAKCSGRIMEVPVGKALLGRVVNAVGEPIDYW